MLNDFKQNFMGGARPNRFRVTMTFPAGAGAAAGRKFQYQCTGAELPGTELPNIPVYFMGRQIKYPGDRVFAPINLTILNDIDFLIRDGFEEWLKNINGHESNVGSVSMDDYWATCVVEQLGRDDSILKTYTLIDAHPINISPVELEWGDNDTVERFTVTLDYNWWE
jgi:hypothetical protein